MFCQSITIYKGTDIENGTLKQRNTGITTAQSSSAAIIVSVSALKDPLKMFRPKQMAARFGLVYGQTFEAKKKIVCSSFPGPVQDFPSLVRRPEPNASFNGPCSFTWSRRQLSHRSCSYIFLQIEMANPKAAGYVCLSHNPFRICR